MVCLRTASPWQQHHYQNSSFFHSFALFLTPFLPPSLHFARRSPSPLLMRNISPPPPCFFLHPNHFIPSRTYLRSCASYPCLSSTSTTTTSPSCPVALSFYNPFPSLIFPSAVVPNTKRLIYLFCSHIVRRARIFIASATCPPLSPSTLPL